MKVKGLKNMQIPSTHTLNIGMLLTRQYKKNVNKNESGISLKTLNSDWHSFPNDCWPEKTCIFENLTPELWCPCLGEWRSFVFVLLIFLSHQWSFCFGEWNKEKDHFFSGRYIRWPACFQGWQAGDCLFQITLSYSKYGDKENVVNVAGFSHEEDPTR